MQLRLWIVLAVLGLSALDENQAVAQYGGVGGGSRSGGSSSPGGIGFGQGASVSPYLQLTRRNNSAYLNYYGLVRPAFDLQNSLQGLQQQVNEAQSTGQAGMGGNPLFTGSRTRFLDTGGYFLSSSGQSGGSNRSGSAVMIVNPQQLQGGGALTTSFQGSPAGGTRGGKR